MMVSNPTGRANPYYMNRVEVWWFMNGFLCATIPKRHRDHLQKYHE